MSGIRRWMWLASALVVICGVALAVPSALVARNAHRAIDIAAQAVRYARIAQASEVLNDAVRVERGQGTIYLNDLGVNADRLQASRAVTDDALSAWNAVISGLDVEQDAAHRVEEAGAKLRQLAAERQAVSNRSVAPDQSFVWYAGLVSQLIAVAARADAVVARAGDTPVSTSTSVSLLLALEELGQERDQVAGMLAAGTSASQAAVLEVAARRAARATALANVSLAGSLAETRALAEIQNQPIARSVHEIETSILARRADRLASLDPEVWFNAASQLLEAYGAVLGIEQQERQSNAARMLTTARDDARQATGIAWAVLAGALLLGLAFLAGARLRISRSAAASARLFRRASSTREAMLQAVLANSQSQIYVKDLEGHYLMANAPLLKKLALTEDQLIGHDDTIISAELAPIWRKNDEQARSGEYAFEEYSDDPDGRHYYDSVKFPLHDPDGLVYAVCGVSLDVTASRQAAQAMSEATLAAIEASAAKSSFLATMSHEIRTPMNAVIGMTDLLLATDLDVRQQEYVETVRTSGDALLSVINNILDYSRFEAGSMDLEMVPFDLRRCVEESLAVVAVTASGLDLVADIDPECPRYVNGDPAKLRQVLVNLVGNAVKFTEHGDVLVTVTAQSVTGPDGAPADPDDLDSRESTSIVLSFAVRDTGIGIPPERMDRLFKSFSQIDSSTTRLYGGTGLGLAISRAIVQAMGGDISVSSEVGTGSTFSFTLRLDRITDDASLPPAPAPLAELRGRSVLIVDDNDTNRRVLRLQLENDGMVCAEAASGTEALLLLGKSAKFDVAILDFNMPLMDGRELALKIKELPAHRGTPLLLLTSLNAAPDDASEYFAGHHTKPIRVAALRLMLSEAVGYKGATRSDKRIAVPAPRSGRALKVLLAEDNRVNQKVAQGMLANLGHLVDIADDGQEALQALERTDYDVVLMDIHMPNLDGLAATRAIRAGFPLERQPHIIALTASSLPGDRHACAEAGMDAHLLKPVRSHDLEQALNAIPRQATILGRQPVAEHHGVATGPIVPEREPVDPDVLLQLFTEMGDTSATLQREVIDMYLAQSDGWIEDLTAAARDGDTAQVRQITHTLSSGSALIGAQGLADLLVDLGARARAGETDLIPAAEAAATEYRRVAAVLRARRDGLVDHPDPSEAGR